MNYQGARQNQLDSLEDAIKRCQELGMRLSRQRRFILELLWQKSEHLSAKAIYELLNQQGKDIGYTSVYQNLEALSAKGIIECVDRCTGRLYSRYSQAHSHLNCLDTEEIIDIQVDLPEELIKRIEAETGVKILEYQINFYGYRRQKPF